MRAVILADRSMAVRERGMLARLEVGLVGEGVRVVHAIPVECVDAEPIGLYSTPIAYENGWWWTRPSRVRRLAERLRKTFDEDEIQCVDLVHVFAAEGSEAWEIARELANITRAALLIEVVSGKQAASAAALAKHQRVVHPPSVGAGSAPILAEGDGLAEEGMLWSLGFACPDRAMEQCVRGKLGTGSASSAAFAVPWGVHADDEPPPARKAGAPISIGILAASKSRWLNAAIEGIALYAAKASSDPRGPGVLLFVGTEDTSESSEAVAAHVWKLARKFGILSRFTLVPGMEAKRDPVMSLDVLAVTDCGGMHRSITLDAMAGGVAVIAPPDGLVDDLEGDVTCRVVTNASASAWMQVVERHMSDAAGAAALRRSAWEYVRRRRSASSQIVAAMHAYDALVGGKAGVAGGAS